MTKHKTLAITGTTILCLWPTILAAQEQEPSFVLNGSVEIGAGYSSEDSFKFGEYTGLSDEGAFFIGNVDAIARDAYDDDSAYYLELQGRNLGLENRSIDLEAGSQGRFGGSLNYSQIPHYRQQDAVTPYSGEGTNVLALPPTWPDVGDVGAPQTTTGVTTILPVASMRRIDLVNRRERFGGSLFWLPRENWRFDVDYRNERKTGTQTTFGMFGENGGNPLSVALAEPTEYETNEIDAFANYASGNLQLQASYSGSFFNDRYDSLIWHNAYTGGTTSGNAWTDIPDEGQMALPPDNQAHNFTLSGGYTLSPTTRVTGSLGYGIMLQDEDFLPYTINPGIAIATPLPRTSLDGEINTLRADLGISSRLTSALDLSGRYRFSDRQNETPRDQYAYVPNDAGTQGGNGTRINTPHSFTQHLANLDAAYRLGTYTRLSLGYEYENMERTFSERDKTEEHTFEAKLRGRPTDSLSGWVSYAYGWRDGDTYVGNAPYRASTFPDPGAGAFENHPELRKLNIADRTRNEVRAVANWMTSDAITTTFGANYALDDYDDTTIGLTEGETIGAKADVSYAASENLTAYGYYAYDRTRYEQKGHRFVSFPPLNNLTDPAQRWSVETTDQVHTLGAGIAWAGFAENVNLTLDYAYSRARTAYDPAGGVSSNGPTGGGGATTDDLPDVETDIHSVELAADYAVTAGVTVRFAYLFEYYDSADWALDGVGVDSITEVLWFGGDSPDYTAHVIGISTVIAF